MGLPSLIIKAQDHHHSIEYIENIGQWPSQILFKADVNSQTGIFIENDGITVNICQNPLSEIKQNPGNYQQSPFQIKGLAYKIKFLNSQEPQIAKKGASDDYINYYNSDNPSNWKSGVKKYDEVRLSDIYPGIDIRFSSGEDGLKYDIIILPGANPSLIKMQYEGIKKLTIKDKKLIIPCDFASLEEDIPKVWRGGSSLLSNPLVQFSVKNNIVSFDIQNYSSEDTLYIDPSLIFSTYSGSSSDNWGFTGTFDSEGNVYSGGIVFGSLYPVSLGAYQTTFGGNCDIGIIKYNPSGTQRLFATYLGGTYADLPHSLIVNQAGDLLVFGSTGSANFPVTNAAYDQSFNGGPSISYGFGTNFPLGSDIFVSCLSSSGTQLKYSTFIGGSGNDGLHYRSRYNAFNTIGNDSLYFNYGDGARGEITIDENDNIIIGSTSFSSDFPLQNPFQNTRKGQQDGVLFKLNPQLSTLLWSSYLGGNSDDAIYSVDVDENNQIYCSGGTLSSNFPVSPSAYKTNYQGGSADGFISHISENGQQIISSTYFGSSSYDQCFFMRTDKKGSVYVYGQTKAAGSSLMINATYGQPNSGQFIARLPYNLQTLNWSTVFGTSNGKPNISPTAFMVDKCKRIYVSGWGRIWGNSISGGVSYPWGSVFGTVNMPLTPDAIQPLTDGQDFYVAVFGQDASHLEYATFFGERYYTGCSYSGHDHVDGGTSRFDPSGNIIQSVCASCGGCQQFPTQPNPGAWSNVNASSNCNNAIFKMSLKSDFALASFIQPSDGCAPYSVQFQNLSRGTSYLWDFDDPSSGSLNTSTSLNPTHIYQSPGTYTIQLISYLPGSCNLSDTTYRTLSIGSDSTLWLDSIQKCNNTPISIGWTGIAPSNATFNWVPSTGLNSSTIQNPMANPASSTLYTCYMQTAACQDTFLQLVEVASFSATAGTDTVYCSSPVTLTGASTSPNSSFLWSSNPAFSDTLNNYPSDSLINVSAGNGSYTYYLKVISSFGCIITDSVSIQITNLEMYITNPGIICKGDTAHVHAISIFPPHNLEYLWSPASMILGSTTYQTVIIQPDTSFWLVLKTKSADGCVASDSLWIQADLFHVLLRLSHPACYGRCTGSAALNIMNGILPYTIQWSTGDSGRSISKLCPGNYQVYVQDLGGCDTLLSFEIQSKPPLQAVTVIQNPNCFGDSTGYIHVQVSGGLPPYTFQWSNGSTSQNLNAIPAGVYHLTITDNNHCDTSFSFTLTNPPPFVMGTYKTDVLCYGFATGRISLIISGGNPPYSIYWSNGMTGNNIHNLQAGDYTAQLIDISGCDTTFTISISQPPALLINPVITPLICHNSNNGSIELQISGGVPPYSILWNNGNTGSMLTGLSSGQYAVNVIDANNCSVDSIFMLESPPAFNIESILNHVSCKSYQDANIQVIVEGGSPPYIYEWSTGSNLSSISGLGPGIYTLTISDNHNCDTTLSFNVLEAADSLHIQLIPKNPTCAGSLDGEIQSIITGGQSPYGFLWNNVSLTQNLSEIPAGNYQLTVNDAFGCIRQASINLIDYPGITWESEVSNQKCGGGVPEGSIKLQFYGGLAPYQYLWSDGETTANLNNLSAGPYNLQMTDAAGCIKDLSFIITAPPVLDFAPLLNEPPCFGSNLGSITGSIEGGTPPYQIIWNNGQHETSLYYLKAGIYSCIITDKNNCRLEKSFSLSQPDSVIITKEYSEEVCQGFTDGFIILEVDGGTPPFNCSWNIGWMGLSINNLTSGLYLATLTDAEGCLTKDSTRILEKDCELFIPNVITPNSDGYNDYFVIVNIEYYPQNELIIFNRWGNELIRYTGYMNQWDGRNSAGEKVSDGVYYYLLSLGNGRLYKGIITVIR